MTQPPTAGGSASAGTRSGSPRLGRALLGPVARRLDTEPEVIALSFARMADALGNSLLIIVLPLYVAAQPAWQGLRVELLVGIVISLYGFLFALAQPLTGWLSDRLGRRRPFILAGLALMAAASLGFIPTEHYLWTVVLRGLQGLGVALIVPSVLALITAATATEKRGNAMGIYSTFRMVGFATGPVLAGLLQVRFGYNAVFVAGAVFVTAALVLVYLTVAEVDEGGDGSAPDARAAAAEPPDVRAGAAEPPDVRAGAAESRGQPERGSGSDVADAPTPTEGAAAAVLGRVPADYMLALMFSSIVLASSLSMISALEAQFNERLSQTAVGFGVAFSALTLSRLVVQIPIGRLSDRIGRRIVILAGLITLAPITVGFAYVATTLQLVGLRLLQGVATAGIASPAFALAGDLAPEGGEGQQMSYVAMGFGLGLAVGPLVTGGMAGYLGFDTPFWLFGALAVIAGAWVWRTAPETVGGEATGE